MTWRTFFASMISTFTLNIVLSTYHGVPGNLSYPGLLNLGKFDAMSYEIYEIPVFMIMGTIGGLLGALWNHINYKITCFRMKYLRKKWLKVLEVICFAVVSATMGFVMIYTINDCQPLDHNNSTDNPVQLNCNDREYSAVAALWFQTPEQSVRSLFHDLPGSHSETTLGVFVTLYFILAVFTFGLSVSGGLFIPTLLIGSAWGRLIGSFLKRLCPGWVN